jgi:hypothetical protein
MSNAKAGLKLGLYIGLLIISLCNIAWMQYIHQELTSSMSKAKDETAASLACSVVSSIWCLAALAIHLPMLAGRSELLPASIFFPVELIMNISGCVWILIVAAMSTKDYFPNFDVCSTQLISCYPIFGWLMFVYSALLIMTLFLPTKAASAGADGATAA